MSDKSIQDTIHSFEGNYEALAKLLTCYEAWGGGPREDADCAQFLDSSSGENQ
ncbi:MAG TPA: hypothetical protein VM325_18535 [Alphaproteobacteria bacterium]|nr:hypothetical protein [Alphaproteobacteria bacterium]